MNYPAKPRPCYTCKKPYTPKPGGHRGVYCSPLCKGRGRMLKNPQLREYLRVIGAATYRRIMADPKRAAKRRAYDIMQRKATRGWLANYKMERGCLDCGFRAHSSALQLDHEGEKSIEIANARSSVKRLQKEIVAGKCVVRCANCHSIKTWAQKNGLDYRKVRVQLGLATKRRA